MKRIHLILTVLLVSFPLFPLIFSSITIIVWVIVSFIIAFRNRFKISKDKTGIFILFISIFFVFLFSLLWTENLHEGLFFQQKSLSLLVIPAGIILFSGNYDTKNTENIFRIFILSSLLISIIPNALLIIKGFEDVYLAIHDQAYIYRTEFEKLSNLHPTYMAMLLLFAALLKIHLVLKYWKSFSLAEKIFNCLVIGMLLTFSTFLASRTPLIAFSIALIVMILLKYRKWKIGIISISSVIIMLLISITMNANMRLRINEGIKSVFVSPNNNDFNSTNLRWVIYKCSSSLIKKQWWCGYGSGDVQYELNKCYEGFEINEFSKRDFNSHNEYLHIWLCAGILGFLIFCGILLIPLYMAIKNKDFLYAAFLIFCMICFMTENILSRQIGVIFYSFFNALFAIRLGKYNLNS
ncbi:O-antigen ligase family protein [Bacteroidota bacterium]